MTRTAASVRVDWEQLARLLDLPAIDARGGTAHVRAAEDLDRSARELTVEGKIGAEWQERPPPAGLHLAHQGGEDAPEGQAILVTLTAPRNPLWLYAALLDLAGFLAVLGICDLALLPILFGAGVVWHRRFEQRSPRPLRIDRENTEIDMPNPGNQPTQACVPHAAVESVDIGDRHERSVIGKPLRLMTDQGEFAMGSQLSDEALDYLRTLIVSAIASA